MTSPNSRQDVIEIREAVGLLRRRVNMLDDVAYRASIIDAGALQEAALFITDYARAVEGMARDLAAQQEPA